MKHVINKNIPVCLKCSGLMLTRGQQGSLYFVCSNCSSIFKVIGDGTADVEIVVTDKEIEDEKEST